MHPKETRKRWGGAGEASAIVLDPKRNVVVPLKSSAFPTRQVALNKPLSWPSPRGLLIWSAPDLHVNIWTTRLPCPSASSSVKEKMGVRPLWALPSPVPLLVWDMMMKTFGSPLLFLLSHAALSLATGSMTDPSHLTWKKRLHICGGPATC